MKHLQESLKALLLGVPSFKQAVENVLADVKDPTSSPHGNLQPDLVSLLDDHCAAGHPVGKTIDAHTCFQKPDLHHRVANRPDPVRRAMSRATFVIHHVLTGSSHLTGSSELAECDAWNSTLQPGTHRLEDHKLQGRTARVEGACWWTFDESGRPGPEDGRSYLRELALGVVEDRKAAVDGFVVEVRLAEGKVGPLFKPTALEGFSSNTLFRPELTGADHGRTAPSDAQDRSRPEIVGASQAYWDILDPGEELEIEVLSY